MSTLQVATIQSINDTTNLVLGVPSSPAGMTISAGNTYIYMSANVSVTDSVYAIHFDNVSDEKLKENVESIKDASQKTNQLNPVTFNWIKNGQKSYGLIAQEVEAVLPEIVKSRDDGIKTIEYNQLIAVLIATIKEQQAQIDDINRKLNNMPSNPQEVEDGKL